MGYKPACEVVCPTQAILSGDLDDPQSPISQRVATSKVSVRKPEKGTKPKLFYVGVDGDLLNPTMMEPQPSHFWAEKSPGEDLYALAQESSERSTPGAGREVYDVPHVTPWGKKIAFYLWTKSIAAGVLLLAALLLNMGFEEDTLVLNFFSPALSLIFLAATMLLLVFDLKRPGRFFYLFTKPNLRSWLVLGGYVLMIFGVLASVWLFQGLTQGSISSWIVWSTALFAVASAGYSAFLFAQARGRDFWQSPLLFWHLLIQAMMAGAAVLMLAGTLVGLSLPVFYWLANLLVISLLAGLGTIFAEHFMNRRSEEVARAADLLFTGALRKQFWIFVIFLGAIAPIALILWPSPSLIPNMIASVLVLAGLWFYENLWLKAGQAVPLS
jgi:formate-dependent nitrite reductase membrane component NrfD